MPKIRLTERWLETLSPARTAAFYWDTKQSGLGVRLSAKGEAYFVADYRVRGSRTRRRIALGKHGAITLEEARQRARKLVSAGLDGCDPVAESNAKARRPTFDALVATWLDVHVARKRSPRTLDDYGAVYRRYLQRQFGSVIAADIRRSAVVALHAKMAETPKAANYAIVVGKAAFNYGLRSELLPAGLPNPFSQIELYPSQAHERYLSGAEVVRISQASAELEASGEISPWAAAALRLYLLTGARKSELLTLRWEWVDLEQRALLLPRSKTGKRHVKLNAAALQVLCNIPRVQGNPFVIVGQKSGSHMVSLTRPWRRICAKAEVTGCRIHDLRHSFASFAAADGLSLLIIGRLLGHTVPATTQRYAHLTDDALTRASDGIGARLAPLLAGPASYPGARRDGN